MGARNLLLFCSDDCPDLTSIVERGQWNICLAPTLEHAINTLQTKTFFVGLLVINGSHDQAYLDQLEKLLTANTETVWIMVLPADFSAYPAKYARERQLLSQYCQDFHSLPVNNERLLFSLGHAYGMAEITHTPYKTLEDYPDHMGIIGESPAMSKLICQIKKIAQEECSVLIEGETGTGKELIAQYLHKISKQARQPFIAINCGAIPKDLIQSELFGHEKGAFTGASHQKIGYIESAHTGTLFLDEIGDLPLDQQTNLLRFLEQRSIHRVGGVTPIHIDTRIIAATHIDLKSAIQQGLFRQDLYYRLRILHLEVPALRDRNGDIELLAWYFFQQFSKRHKYKARGFSLDALSAIEQYTWPGNVRELSNCIRHAVVMSENKLLTPADLGLERRAKERNIATLEDSRCIADRQAITSCLHYTNYNMTKTAELLGISRVTLYRLIEKYQLNLDIDIRNRFAI